MSAGCELGSGFPSSNNTWTSEANSSGNYYNVNLTTGNVNNNSDSNNVACRQGVLTFCTAAQSSLVYSIFLCARHHSWHQPE